MRLILLFLLLGVALASEIPLDEGTLLIKIASDNLEVALNEYIQAEEEEAERSWIKNTVNGIKNTAKGVGKLVAGVSKEASKSFNEIGKELNKIQAGAVDGVVSGIEKLPKVVKHAGVIGKEFEKVFVEIRNNCDCKGMVCQCCSTVIPSQKICFELKIDADNLAVGAGLSWNNNSFKKEFSLKNPGPLCVAMPNVPICSFCITPKDLELQDNTFSGCFKIGLKIKLLGEILSQEITCAKGSTKGLKFTPPRSRGTKINLPGLKATI